MAIRPDALFSKDEITAIGKLLHVTLADPPILRHDRFQTLTGLYADEAWPIIHAWPEVDLEDATTYRTVFGTITSLINYPHRQKERLYLETGLGTQHLRTIKRTLRAAKSHPR